MKLAYVDLCGFRGYRKPLRIDFANGFTIVDGRNGAGKSTIFDAVEFALTGTISKYGDAKADRETVADYIWWSGEGPRPTARYVEIAFGDGDSVYAVRRTEFGKVDPRALNTILELLCDTKTSPKEPLPQLCTTSIIRDELISALSLDLKEADRYSLLLEAIGATDADKWIERGSKLLSAAKRRVEAAEREVEIAAEEMAAATLRVDEIRAGLYEETTVAAAAARLQSFTGSTAVPDQLVEPTRAAIAEKLRQLEQLASLGTEWQNAYRTRKRVPELEHAISTARETKANADAVLAGFAARDEVAVSSAKLAQQARDIAALVALGRKIGLHEGQCPLCANPQTDSEFVRGLAVAENYAKQLDAHAVEEADHERAKEVAIEAATAAQVELERYELSLRSSQSSMKEFESLMVVAGLSPNAGVDELFERQQALSAELDAAREDLRIIETLKLNTALEKSIHEEAEAKITYTRAEGRLGLARRAEGRAQTLQDATRRSAGETLNQRLERVLPLMAELYRRLRPHPVWGDIDYKIRGDVRRFLKLQVGNELNPQFIFSSGQRRATGLAFLISVNLSLAWSRWRTLLLDDPVQHIDDFRSIQLAEVLAQLSASGRQIICAVEDAALADLLCRRLPVEGERKGKRVTLGADSEGALAKLNEQDLAPLPQQALVMDLHRMAG